MNNINNIHYISPKDIPVHFFGETVVDFKYYSFHRALFQLTLFFALILLHKNQTATKTYNLKVNTHFQKSSIKFYKNDRFILGIYEDSSNEWVFNLKVEDVELLTFISECTEILKLI